MYSVSVTGADGQPSVVPVCGMPLNSSTTSDAPGSPFARLPTATWLLRKTAAFAAAAEDDGEHDDDRDDRDDTTADRKRARRSLAAASAGRPDGRRRLAGRRADAPGSSSR